MSQLTPDRKNPPTDPSWVAHILQGAALVVFLLSLCCAVLGPGSRLLDTPIPNSAAWVEIGIYLVSGLIGGGALLGVSWLYKLLHEIQRLSDRTEYLCRKPIESSPTPRGDDQPTKFVQTATGQIVSAVSNTPPTSLNGSVGEMVRLLEDIRDNSLLTDEERREKRLVVSEDEIRQTQLLVRSLINRKDFAVARQAAERIQRKYPHDDRAATLAQQVEDAREQQEADDVNSAIRQAEDLISISAWPQARELAQQLQERHPDSAEARQLLLRIERECQAAVEEQRRRMHAEIQRCVTRRRWEDALNAARLFIEKFPGCEEASAMRLELPTLETNAEIEKRQKWETQIMDYVKHGRYIEAVELAKKMIEKYPNSPQAEALRSQLPRLEELANNPNAAPARQRVNE